MNPATWILLACLSLCSSVASALDSFPDERGAIQQLLETEGLSIDGTTVLGQSVVLQIYRDNYFKPYWTSAQNIGKLVDLIGHASDHGLNTADYDLVRLRRIQRAKALNPDAGISAEEDILLTESLLRYTYHRRYGKVKASSMDPDINFRREAFRNQPPGETLHQMLDAPSLQGFIDAAAPSGPFYQGIQRGLNQYRRLAETGGWPTVPVGPALREGGTDPRVIGLKQRLLVTGELPPNADLFDPVFDEQLTSAVMKFQSRHALEADGVVGKQTLAAMNVPVETRINQLRATLERLRWVNQEASRTFVAVNIAGFTAFFFRDGEIIWSTRAMVGKNYRRTPIFRGDIQYMEFNPTWTIPPTILREDTLPAIKRDPNYLASKNIRVIDGNGKIVDPGTIDWGRYTSGVPYTLRQDPGPFNALGTVKFIFPNKHAVFLHDTPYRELFDRPERAFSSGCIRIEHPLKLAELLLDDENYSEAVLQSVVDSRRTQRINLATPVPVIILYLTASLDKDGNMLFYRDIYNIDNKLLEAIDGPVIIELPVTSG
jgi:murein L,D-transpeptidase YcbB/YkuD